MRESLFPLIRTDTSPGSALLAPDSPLHLAGSWIDACRTAGRLLGTAARSGTAQRGLRDVLAAAARSASLDIHANPRVRPGADSFRGLQPVELGR